MTLRCWSEALKYVSDGWWIVIGVKRHFPDIGKEFGRLISSYEGNVNGDYICCSIWSKYQGSCAALSIRCLRTFLMSGKILGFNVHDNPERSIMYFLMPELLRLHFAKVGRWVTCTYKSFISCWYKTSEGTVFLLKVFRSCLCFVIMSYDVIRMTNFGPRRHLKVLLCIFPQAFRKFHCVNFFVQCETISSLWYMN